jgi:hypothetical protein
MRPHEFISLLCGVCLAWVVPAQAQQPDQRVADLVTAGKIRMGVFPSFQYSKGPNGEAGGLAIGITRALASRLGIGEVITVEYPTPPQVVECVKSGGCHVGFMLIDPARATEVDFTPPFVRSDFTYLLPPGSAMRNAADVDRAGVRIAAVRGHASTAALLRIITPCTPTSMIPRSSCCAPETRRPLPRSARCCCNIPLDSPARGYWRTTTNQTSRVSRSQRATLGASLTSATFSMG